MNHPTCFISYAWESAAHKEWVLDLATSLQESGVYVRLDQWDVSLGLDLTQYMESAIRDSDFVLLICTPTFAQKANNGSGGVGYEKTIVTGEIFVGSHSPTKFVPILRNGSPDSALPSYLKSRLFVDFRESLIFETSLLELIRHLHSEPAAVRPPIGVKPNLSASSATSSKSLKRVGSHLPMQSKSAPAATTDALARLRKIRELQEFAYSSGGLDLSKPESIEWAERRADQVPPFNLSRFKALMDFAYSTSGLDLSKLPAIEWAMARAQTDPPFALARFQQFMEFAYSTSGLDLTKSAAIDWATEQIERTPAFDLDVFKELMEYAFSHNGLDLSKSEAILWAMRQMISSLDT